MKAGFTVSVLAHVAILTGAVVSLAAPTPLPVIEVEALPIDIVPFEDLTKSVTGAKEAEISKEPAPKQTKRPPKPKPEPAENVGDTDVDKKVEAPKEAPKPPVEKTEAPTPQARPEPVKKPTPVPIPELAEKPKPKTDIALLTKQNELPEPEPEKPAEEAFEKLPQKVARPKVRPSPQKPQPAETNERKNEDQPKPENKKTAEKKPTKKVTKKAVVNKEESSKGGAKRSKKQAAKGVRKGNSSSKLAQSEIDAVRGRLEGCWNVGALSGHPDAQKMRAKVEFKLTKSGEIDGRVKVKVTGTDRGTRATLAVNVRGAIQECAPYNNLPTEKYDTWRDMVVNFSLQDML